MKFMSEVKIIGIKFEGWKEYDLPDNCKRIMNVWVAGFNIDWKVENDKLILKKKSAWYDIKNNSDKPFEDEIKIRYLA